MNIESGKTKVRIIKQGRNHSALINQIGIIVKILPNGFNVWLDYFNMPNYNDMIYYYDRSEVQRL